jgi:hypothetical protein
MEIDEIAVDTDDWRLTQAGDVAAKARIQNKIDKLYLYMHIMPVEDSETVVTLRDLEKYNVIEGVRIYVQ